MSTLSLRLTAIKKSFHKQAGPTVSDLFERTTQDLIESGLAEKALTIGAEFPDFALPDAHGNTVRFSEAREGTAAVVTFFRGKW